MKTLRQQFDDGEITAEEFANKLEAENEALRANQGGALRLKVTDKGGVSAYGLGRFPVTLYKSQWVKLLSNSKLIVEFLKAHEGELSEKAETKAAA